MKKWRIDSFTWVRIWLKLAAPHRNFYWNDRKRHYLSIYLSKFNIKCYYIINLISEVDKIVITNILTNLVHFYLGYRFHLCMYWLSIDKYLLSINQSYDFWIEHLYPGTKILQRASANKLLLFILCSFFCLTVSGGDS